jgi:hypothetical protein
MDNSSSKTEASQQQLDREKKGSATDDIRTSLTNSASLSANGPANLILTPRQTSNINNGALAYPTAALLKGPHQHAIAANVFGTMGVQQGGFNNSMIRGYPNPTNVLMTQYPTLTTFLQEGQPQLFPTCCFTQKLLVVYLRRQRLRLWRTRPLYRRRKSNCHHLLAANGKPLPPVKNQMRRKAY